MMPNHINNHNNAERTYPEYQSCPKPGVNSVRTINTIQESNTSKKNNHKGIITVSEY